jgi:hypothetical protein
MLICIYFEMRYKMCYENVSSPFPPQLRRISVQWYIIYYIYYRQIKSLFCFLRATFVLLAHFLGLTDACNRCDSIMQECDDVEVLYTGARMWCWFLYWPIMCLICCETAVWGIIVRFGCVWNCYTCLLCLYMCCYIQRMKVWSCVNLLFCFDILSCLSMYRSCLSMYRSCLSMYRSCLSMYLSCLSGTCPARVLSSVYLSILSWWMHDTVHLLNTLRKCVTIQVSV